MIKKYLPFHQFKTIDESIVSEMIETEGNCITFDLPSVDDMVNYAEDGYYHDSNCEVYFYLPKYGDEPIIAVFEISFSFDERYDTGDYFNPPDHEVFNKNLEVCMTDIIMENYNLEINLSSDEIKKLEIFIEDLLTD